MARFAVASKALRGPFKRLITKLELTGRRAVINVSPNAGRRFRDTELHARTAIRAAQERAADIRRTTRKPRPRAVTAAVDRTTGRVVGIAVPREQVLLPAGLQGMLPDPSLEPWSSANCGEVSAAALAMQDGYRLEDLVIRTVKLGSGKILLPCKNCITWVGLGD